MKTKNIIYFLILVTFAAGAVGILIYRAYTSERQVTEVQTITSTE